MSAPRSHVNALHWIGGAAAFAATIYWWDGFSGPFLALIDLQVALTGRFYWEPLAVGILLTPLLFVAFAIASLLNPIVPRYGENTWGVLFLVFAALCSAAALAWAWRQWTAPPGPIHRNPPLRVLDLDRLDAPDIPFGPVRIIGRADRADLRKLRREPRGYNIYQPLSGLHRPARDMPVPVIVHCYSRRGVNCIPDALEGWLYPGADDERDTYRLRRAGVLRTPDFYMLSPGLPTSDVWQEASDRDRGGAIATAMMVGLFWFVVIFTLIKAPPSAFPAKPRPPGEPAPTPVFDSPRKVLLLAPVAGVTAFIFLSVLGVISAAFQFLSQVTP